MENFNEHESDWTIGKAKTLCYCSSIYIVSFVSPREYVITSLILFYPIYWYYLKIERNIFQFLSLFSTSIVGF